MKNKTCGECQWYDYHHLLCVVGGDVKPVDCACDSFIPIKRTNGDVIRNGSNRELAEFLWKLYNGHICSLCVFLVADDDRKQVICKRPPDKTCTDGIEAWLNAPAESEGKNE